MRFPVLFLSFILAWPAVADEGMWPFNQFPKDTITQKYKFEVAQDYLDKLRLASLQIGHGAGSFVSPNGLIITDRRTVSECLKTPKDSFYAPTQNSEPRCTGLDAAVLLSIEDVTSQVKTSAKDNVAMRAAAIARIEQECVSKTGNRCTVVKLFSGGRYDLYQSKVFSDIRLVFVPEHEVAFFGRERDSVTYLRYGLDVAFLRAYENGKPAATPHFLKWSTESIKEGDLVFSAGNPAPTSRLATSAQLAFYRDTALPFALSRLQSRIQLVGSFAAQSAENLRVAQPTLTKLLGDFKLSAGKLIGLRDDRLVSRKTTFEGKIRRAVQASSKSVADASKLWDEVAAAYKSWTPFEKPYQVLEAAPAPGSILFAIARQLIRGTEDNRLIEAPTNESFEILLLTRYFEEIKNLGDKEAPVKAVLEGRTPQQAAEAYVKSTKLKDVSERRRLAASRDLARKSDDNMIRLALLLDEPARKLAKKHEDLIGSLETSAGEKIAQYRFRLFGAADYPDATSTPRVEFGVVKGYTDRAGVAMPYVSTFGGMYYRKNNEGPYEVPQIWVDLKPALDLATPMDFVSTCDIGGGDYGGPTVNRAGELVGVTFDGNLESLPDVYLYSDEQARAVHVSAQGIAVALEKVYKAMPLLQELGVHGAAVSSAVR